MLFLERFTFLFFFYPDIFVVESDYINIRQAGGGDRRALQIKTLLRSRITLMRIRIQILPFSGADPDPDTTTGTVLTFPDLDPLMLQMNL
jgi:hypothetical protein